MNLDPVLQRVARLSQTAVEAMANMDAETNLQEMLSAAFVTTQALMAMALDASPTPEARLHNEQVLQMRLMDLFGQLGQTEGSVKH